MHSRSAVPLLLLWTTLGAYGGTVTPLELALHHDAQLFGRDHSVTGLRLGLLGAFNEAVTGLDFTVGGSGAVTMRGVQIGCIGAMTEEQGAGIQVSGWGNAGEGDFRGVRVAGLCNFISESAIGVQVAGLGNLGGRPATGLHLAGLCNLAVEDAIGVQIAGLANIVVEGTASGLQLALINYCKGLRGVQIGLVNICGEQDWPLVPLINVRF